jgi:glycosyltransferase involved in cell wall biosynthesis
VANLEIAPEEEAFFAFVVKHFDSEKYLEMYSDIAKSGIDPLEHWLNFGLKEGRRISLNVDVRHGEIAKRSSSRGWENFFWRKETIAVRVNNPIAPEIIAQIVKQARHDPAILAPGATAIANLRQFDATDLLTRNGIDIESLLAAIPQRPDVLLIMPSIGMGGAEKFMACLATALRATGYRSIQVLVTNREASENSGWEKFVILEPLRSARVLFWRDVCRNTNETLLARLVNGLRPRIAIVVNSRIGLDMIARFGRGLSQYTRLYCAYFSLGVQTLGFGARFPRRTLRFATALTDNEFMASTLRERYGNLLGHDTVVLPPQVVPVSQETFNARLLARRRRVVSAARPLRWAWVGRIHVWKGTQILSRLATLRPADRFELFGPLIGSLDDLGLVQPNITHCGVIEDISAADFAGYDGFLFTSLFEGMPNVVLEMSQHAIPLVLAQVGGLKETFDGQAAFFVDIINEDEAVAAFSHALDQVRDMTADQAMTMAIAVRNQTLRRHAPEVFAHNVATLFGRP